MNRRPVRQEFAIAFHSFGKRLRLGKDNERHSDRAAQPPTREIEGPKIVRHLLQKVKKVSDCQQFTRGKMKIIRFLTVVLCVFCGLGHHGEE